MSWTIFRRWATNTTSRHAFYQTIYVREAWPVKKGVGIMHWGKLTPVIARSHRVVDGGQTKLQSCDKSWIDGKFSEKTQGDYVSEGETKTEVADEAALRRVLTDILGAKVRDDILPALGLKTGADTGTLADPVPIHDDPSQIDTGIDSLEGELERMLGKDDPRVGAWS